MSTVVFLIATYYYCGMCSRKNSKSSYMCNCSNKVIHLNGLQIFDFKMCTYSLLIICQYVENAKCFLLHFSYHVKHGLVQILCPSLTIFPHYFPSLPSFTWMYSISCVSTTGTFPRNLGLCVFPPKV